MTRPASAFHPFSAVVWTAIIAVLAWYAWPRAGDMLDRVGAVGLRAGGPDWALLADQGPAVLIHLAAVLAATVIGLVQLLGPKGTTAHRALGWIWTAAMLATAVSSLFIRTLNDGAFSHVHVLSVWVLLTLPVAVWAARTGRVALHKRTITGLFAGGVLIAGVFAALPGRLLWAVFVG